VVFVFFSHSCSRWLDSQTLETQIQPSTVYCRPQGYCQGRLGWLEGRVLGADTCSWLINKLTACHSVACSSGWHAQNSQTHGAGYMDTRYIGLTCCQSSAVQCIVRHVSQMSSSSVELALADCLDIGFVALFAHAFNF